MAQVQPWKWQLWLSPRPARRTITPPEPRLHSVGDAALYEFLYPKSWAADGREQQQEDDGKGDGRLVVRETHYASHPAVRAGLSGPPLHIHLRQTEYFQVEQGTLVVAMNEKEHVLTSRDGVVVVPPGTRHRFWTHASNPVDTNIIFKVWAEPHDAARGFDEVYLRNALGYLRDCDREGIAPSVFQLAMFGCLSETVLTPPFWTPVWILSALHYVLAYWIAGPILGYRETYEEYSMTIAGGRKKQD